MVGHVPSCQVGNCDLVVVSQVVLLFENGCVELLIDVHLWSSEGEAVDQDDFDCEVLLGAILGLVDADVALEYQEVALALLAGELHSLDTRLELRESLHQLHGLVHYEVGILPIVYIREPLVQLCLHCVWVLHFLLN